MRLFNDLMQNFTGVNTEIDIINNIKFSRVKLMNLVESIILQNLMSTIGRNSKLKFSNKQEINFFYCKLLLTKFTLFRPKR